MCSPVPRIITLGLSLVPCRVLFVPLQIARDGGTSRKCDFDPVSLVTKHYPQLRRFAPVLLETFEFRPAAVARELIDAVDVLRTMNREGTRKVPESAPVGFVRRKWGN